MKWHVRVAAFAATQPRATTVVAMWGLMLACNLPVSDRTMYGDAAGYWSLARTFTTGNHFSLDGYVDRLRGYSMPFMFYCVQQAALALQVDEILLFRAVSATLGAALLAIVLPSFLARVVNGHASLLTTSLFCALSLVYWHGHFLYSLSDFPALLLLATGLLWLPPSLARPWGSRSALVSGGCLALAANARPIYGISLVASIGLVAWYTTRAAHRRRAVLWSAAFGLGVVLALLPQSLINSRTVGTRSPFAHAQSGPRQPNLYVQQLAWGVAIQRYETNIGGNFPVAVMFLDARGQDLIGESGTRDPRASIARSRFSARAYLRLVARHPVFFSAAYARHLFNGLDVAYATPYVTRVAPRNALLALVNYLVLSIALVHAVRLLRRFRLRDDGWRIALVTVFVLPAVLAIPTAIECRFLLPMWMLVYGFVTFRLLGKGEAASLVRPWYVSPAVAVGVFVCFMLASFSYSQILGAPAVFEVWCMWC